MAWGLDDILKLLDRWSEWKRMRETPARVDELDRKIEELQRKLAGPYPVDWCRHCNRQSARFQRENNHDKGLIQQIWECEGEGCGERDFRYMKPPTKAA